jgi:glycosyltransferase involved in cell wall biosynthesis
MRVGQNPAKSIEQVPQPERVTVAVVSYIPFLSGYYAESLEVLKACLGSIWENTPKPYDLMLFDNASCPEVRAFLQDAHQQGKLQYLVLSDKNIGKGGAWNFIFSAAPGEVIAYSDSDVYFSPGWLERSLEVLESYPKVGMLTARPLRSSEEFYTSTLEWARQTPGVDLVKGQFISWETYQEHNDSMGADPKEARVWFDEGYEWRAVYNQICVHLGAAHFQFLGPKAALQSMTPFKMDRPMGQVRALDQKLNEAGYLRLCLPDPYVKHMGNRLAVNPARLKEAVKARSGLGKRLANFSLVRRSLLKVYDRIFRMYFG